MTQPDKWDGLAFSITDDWDDDSEPYAAWTVRLTTMIAAALRSAYAQGERAGMERAAVIADEFKAARKLDVEYELDSMDRSVIAARAMGAWLVAHLIRAAKETKNPPSPS